jgi:hypothetical protein
MKKLINEAFRLQQLAGIMPINSLNENTPELDTPMGTINNILSSNKNPKLDIFIKPVKFKLEQAFAEGDDISTILEEVKQEMEYQIERANNNKDLRLIFAKIEAILSNEEAGYNN